MRARKMPAVRLIPAHAGKTPRTGGGRRGTGAHPRSRGENGNKTATAKQPHGSSPLTRGKHILSAMASLASLGSSPLTRGKPIQWRREATLLRLIPAHAGKTRYPESPRASSRAHPRSRGENLALVQVNGAGKGSSPLTRGKQMVTAYNTRTGGLIPTHAGKTLRGRSLYRCPAAHPHSRGENLRMPSREPSAKGSSPLTRGKHGLAGWRLDAARLIPTHAGKTWLPPAPGECTRAHPHSRGENSPETSDKYVVTGSSPLTRGKRVHALARSFFLGLIPAHTGKTSPRRPCPHHAGAHPRSRGENIVSRLIAPRAIGSSPLTRGKRSVGVGPPEFDGLIPAHAGKTRGPPAGVSRGTAHPRSRGENPRGPCRCPSQRGLIPAHAGKTSMTWPLTRTARAHPRSRGENA